MDGFIVINKSAGMTSHDVVNKVRRKLSTKKVGHTGTLDPMATGVLVLCIGEATRLSEYLVGGKKTYRAEITFGIETNTFDMDGDIIKDIPTSDLDIDKIKLASLDFIGEIQQMPPMVSAIKKDGVPLYKLARKGITIERETRTINIYNIDMIDSFIRNDKRIVLLDVTCSAGTYIRSLASDLGTRLGVPAVLSGLHRTCNAMFADVDALDYDVFMELAPEIIVNEYSYPMTKVCDYMPHINIAADDLIDIVHGRDIAVAEDKYTDKETLALIDNEAVAVGYIKELRYYPKKVFVKN